MHLLKLSTQPPTINTQQPKTTDHKPKTITVHPSTLNNHRPKTTDQRQTMTHFELYNIPITLSPNQDLVKQRYYELSRQYHPDFHSQATEADQADVLETASQVNTAFKVFRSREETIKYVLMLKGLLEEEEKYQLSPEFLMEMLELNDAAMDVSSQEDSDALTGRIHNLEKEIYEPVEKIVTGYQEDITSEKELLQVKEYYYRQKYLDRILAGLK
jgi:molecular chaperone HscB